jgi:hypothetical protein
MEENSWVKLGKSRKMDTPRIFTVEGSGDFPFDMLRYDCCWPKDEGQDSYGIPRASIEPRRITLLSHSEHAPTSGRWESFGWRVVGIGVEYWR